MARDKKTVSGDPYMALAAAVINHAVIDCRAGRPGAASWLLTDGQTWLEGLGVDYDADWYESWIRAGCPRHNNRRIRT